MKRYIFIAAALVLATVSCSKVYDATPVNHDVPIGFGSWAEYLTKAPLTDFANNDEFDVYGFKWNAGPADQENVFTGDDVKYNSSTDKWSYSPLRFWDSNFDNYTFFAAFPKDQLASEAAADDYAQRGLFISNELTYNGSDEVLLIAQQKDVANAQYGSVVPLVFKHTGSLVDIKFDKNSAIEDAVVAVTSITLSGIQTKGKYTVASYDGTTNDPVGKTVSSVAGLGWEVAETPVLSTAAAPYVNTTGASLAAGDGVGSSNATALFSNLVLMPQVLGDTSGPKITLTYTITTGTGGTAQTVTYTNKEIYFGKFDDAGESANDDGNLISAWMPGVHYTYYIQINANAIEFSASIDNWETGSAYYYLVN